VVSVYSTDGSSKVKRVHSKTKTGCYKNTGYFTIVETKRLGTNPGF